MTLDYFYGQAGELFSFYRIPKALFQEPRFQSLSTNAKTLYGILLDRMSLSAKNGWLDEQGRVFIIFTIEDVKRALCCADNKATKLLRELEEFGLIERKRRGLGKPSLVYDAFTAKYGLINDKKNARLFDDDSSYYLLCSLENLDENKNLKSKADMFTKRTIRPERVVTSVDTPSEALAVSIGEHGKVDLPYMAELLGTPGNYERITTELSGVIFKDPAADADDPEAGWQTADEYLSGNVRDKLRMAQLAAESRSEFKVNVDALTKAQPKDARTPDHPAGGV